MDQTLEDSGDTRANEARTPARSQRAHEFARPWLRKATVVVVAAAFWIMLLHLSPFVERVLINNLSASRASATLFTAIFIALLAASFAIRRSLILRPVVSFVQTNWEHLLGPRIVDKFRDPIVQCVLVLIALAALVYFTFPDTHLWKVIQLWWGGPALELAATSPEKTLQSTINLPWFKYGQDFGRVQGWRWQGISQNRDSIERDFAQLHQASIKSVVWFLFSDGRGAPRFDANGYVVGLDQDFWQDYDTAIEVARKYNIGIVWVLLDFHWLASGKQENGATLFGRADTIKDDKKRESFFQNALIPILNRHPLEPQIVGWIVINEPENALKDGNVGSEDMAGFIQRASHLIRKYTYRQPVSIGSVDLESLVEYWRRDSKDLDFLVFHHYAGFLPPPADHVRSLMADVHDKPIYIGEFKIDHPPIPLNELVHWADTLGYAGLWGWKFNEDETTPHYEEAKQISDLIAARRSDGDGPRVQFSQRRTLPANSRSAQLTQSIDWWEGHGRQTVLPGVSANIEEWGRKLSELETNMERLKTERRTKEQELELAVAECLAQNNAELQNHAIKADELNLQIDDYENQLDKAKANGDREWEKKVLVWLSNARRNLMGEIEVIIRSDRGITSCEQWRRRVKLRLHEIEAEMRHLLKRPDYVVPADIQVAAAADAIANWYRYRLRWSQKLYQDFWKTELQSSR